MKSINRVDILGIQVDNLVNSEVIDKIEASIKDNQILLVATPNTEFLMRSLYDEVFKKRLIAADIKAPDGIGLLWASTYLSLPWRGRLWGYWQMVYSGASLVLRPSFCRKILKDTVPGSRLVPTLADLASKKGWRIFLLGGAPGVGEAVKSLWQDELPSLLVETSAADPNQPEVTTQIRAFKPELIFIAYSASDQLAWLEKHLSELPSPVVGMGVGGTLDMLAGAKSVESKGIGKAHQTPGLVEKLGLSWLWRLTTEPWRAPRIIIAVPKFIGAVLTYKRQLH